MRRIDRSLVFLGGLVLSAVGGLLVTDPASSQASPAVSISPTSGPIGTQITATVTNCPGGNADGTARLDFVLQGFTPANSELFVPDDEGNATVTIQALDKEGQTESVTAARVSLSQCGQGLPAASAPFTVVRSSVTTTTTVGRPPTPTTTVAGGGRGTPQPAPVAKPVRARPVFTG